jgi:putative SOS response-associated peptidase YedK
LLGSGAARSAPRQKAVRSSPRAGAGITELWNGPDGPLHTVSVITTEPNELMREIHDRMPVIVPPAD